MLSRKHIEQRLHQHQDDRLIDELLANGREAALPLRLLLTDPAGRRSAALGLSLQRLAELGHGRGCEDVARDLLARQETEGGFGTVAATISALAGLLTWRDYGGAAARTADVDHAVARALAHLAASQDEAGLIAGDVDLSLFAARMLMLHEDFLALVRFGDLVEALLDSTDVAATLEQALLSAQALLPAA